MKKFIEIKKGELTTTQIISLILLIAGFIVAIIFLVISDIGKQSEEQICHNSVVTRGSSFIPTDAVPLKCSRSYVCLTEDGSCEGLTNPEIKKVKTQSEAYKILADEMADCWWTFGEGSLDYIGDKATKKNYCSICSQVLLDDSLKQISGFENGNISKDIFYYYLSKTSYSDEETYAEHFFGTNDLDNLRMEIINSENNSLRVGTFGMMDIGKQYYVMMGITTEISTWGWVLRGAAVGGAVVVTLASFGVGGAGFAAVLIGEGVGAAAGAAGSEIAENIQPEIAAIIVEGNGLKNSFMAPTIQEVDPERFALLDCNDITTLS